MSLHLLNVAADKPGNVPAVHRDILCPEEVSMPQHLPNPSAVNQDGTNKAVPVFSRIEAEESGGPGEPGSDSISEGPLAARFSMDRGQ